MEVCPILDRGRKQSGSPKVLDDLWYQRGEIWVSYASYRVWKAGESVAGQINGQEGIQRVLEVS